MAERNPYLERLPPDNCAMMLIDHQTGIMLGVHDFRLDSFRRNVLTLAGAAKLHDLPTVLTGSYVEGWNGPIMSELVEMFPEATKIHRPGPISAWDDPNFVKAVKATGRKKLVMAGVTVLTGKRARDRRRYQSPPQSLLDDGAIFLKVDVTNREQGVDASPLFLWVHRLSSTSPRFSDALSLNLMKGSVFEMKTDSRGRLQLSQ